MDEQEIRVEEFMRRIRRDIDARLNHPASDGGTHEVDSASPTAREQVSLSRLIISAGTIARKPAYDLPDLLAYHDEDFVANAYRAALRREPDGAGASGFLRQLREGRASKVELLGRIRFSREGRAADVPIRGLGRAFAVRTLRRVPVLGPTIGVMQYLARLPRIVKNLERLEAVVFYQDRRLRNDINSVTGEVEQSITRLHEAMARGLAAQDRAAEERAVAMRGENARTAEQLGSLHTTLQSLYATLDAGLAQSRAELERARDGLRAGVAALAEVKADRSTLAGAIREWTSTTSLLDRRAAELAGTVRALEHELNGELESLQERVRSHWTSVLEQERRLRILLDDKGAAASIPAARAESAHLLDAFYASFEDVFRGTAEDIAQRVAVYLPYALDACRATGAARAIDIGCGRGEWLAFLRQHAIPAIGLDTNRVMVERCRAEGLEVLETDALSYLRTVPDATFALLTAFHVIEHLPFEGLIALIDEARRVLLPGGMAIFETPNPENLVVGACNFWYDATHVHPLPPEPMRFVMGARGFEHVDILRLHPRALPPDLRPELLDHEIVNRFYGPQDYALIGRKNASGQI